MPNLYVVIPNEYYIDIHPRFNKTFMVPILMKLICQSGEQQQQQNNIKFVLRPGIWLCIPILLWTQYVAKAGLEIVIS